MQLEYSEDGEQELGTDVWPDAPTPFGGYHSFLLQDHSSHWFALCTVLVAIDLDSFPIVTSWGPGILACSFLGLPPFMAHCWAHVRCPVNVYGMTVEERILIWDRSGGQVPALRF